MSSVNNCESQDVWGSQLLIFYPTFFFFYSAFPNGMEWAFICHMYWNMWNILWSMYRYFTICFKKIIIIPFLLGLYCWTQLFNSTLVTGTLPKYIHGMANSLPDFALITVWLRQRLDSVAINQQITHLPLSSSLYPQDTLLPFKTLTHSPSIKEQPV